MAANSITRIQMQIAITFGQGSGVMPLTVDALEWGLQLLNEQGAFAGHLQNWDKATQTFLESARICGFLAAQYAASAGKTEIDRDHLEHAVADCRAVKCPFLP